MNEDSQKISEEKLKQSKDDLVEVNKKIRLHHIQTKIFLEKEERENKRKKIIANVIQPLVAGGAVILSGLAGSVGTLDFNYETIKLYILIATSIVSGVLVLISIFVFTLKVTTNPRPVISIKKSVTSAFISALEKSSYNPKNNKRVNERTI